MKWTVNKLKALIDNRIPESLGMEYKSALALARKDKNTSEISKDVSAMANSSGGTIIYGLKEDGNYASEIDPVDGEVCTKERLEQLIISNIKPRIECEIYPVNDPAWGNKFVYVTEIKQSHTAHQASDNKYYKRFNFSSVPMEDYEVKDIVNRYKKPDCEVVFWKLDEKSSSNSFVIKVILINTGCASIEHAVVRFGFINYGPYLAPMLKNNNWTDPLYGSSRGWKDSEGNFLFEICNKEKMLADEIKILDDRFMLVCHVFGDAKKGIDEIIGMNYEMNWELLAEDMNPKKGSIKYDEIFNGVMGYQGGSISPLGNEELFKRIREDINVKTIRM